MPPAAKRISFSFCKCDMTFKRDGERQDKKKKKCAEDRKSAMDTVIFEDGVFDVRHADMQRPQTC